MVTISHACLPAYILTRSNKTISQSHAYSDDGFFRCVKWHNLHSTFQINTEDVILDDCFFAFNKYELSGVTRTHCVDNYLIIVTVEQKPHRTNSALWNTAPKRISTLYRKAVLHSAIFLTTCNSILLFRDVNLATKLFCFSHSTDVFLKSFYTNFENSSLIYIFLRQTCITALETVAKR